jgi:hypothetical protein
MTCFVSKPKLLKALFATLLGLAVSAFSCLVAPAPALKFFCALGIAMFAAGLVVIARRWLDPAPQLIISADGIDDRRLKLGPISWRDIASVALDQTAHAQWLTLELIAPEAYLVRLPGAQKALRAANEQLGADHLRIRFTDLDQPINDALLLIQALLTSTSRS